MEKINAVITGIGGYVPDYILNNEELSRMVDTNDEWITTRVGIKERRILTEEGLGSSYLARKAAKQIKNAHGLDVSSACCGFLYTVDMACAFIQSGRYKRVMVIASEKMSSMVDYQDRQTCVLFGDGAAAVMIEATTEEGVGFQDSFLRTDGQGLPFLHMKAGGSVCPASHYTVDHRMHYIYQEGRTVYKYAVTSMSNDVKEIMQRNNLTEADVNWVIPKAPRYSYGQGDDQH